MVSVDVCFGCSAVACCVAYDECVAGDCFALGRGAVCSCASSGSGAAAGGDGGVIYVAW